MLLCRVFLLNMLSVIMLNNGWCHAECRILYCYTECAAKLLKAAKVSTDRDMATLGNGNINCDTSFSMAPFTTNDNVTAHLCVILT